MSQGFNHPLARDAKIWETGGVSGSPIRMMVVITTLELDKSQKGFKADKVARLAGAAKEWLQQHALEAHDFVLINRPRDWS